MKQPQYPLYSDSSDSPFPDTSGVQIDWIEHINEKFLGHLKDVHTPDCPTCLWCWSQVGQELIHLNTEVAQLLRHLRIIYERAEGIEDAWAEAFIGADLDKWRALFAAIEAPFPVDKFTLPLTHRPLRDVIDEAGIRLAAELPPAPTIVDTFQGEL